MNIKPITLQDAEKAYETVKDNGNPNYGDTTYKKELCRFDDGKALFFCAGTLYDGDNFDHYCRLGIENPNAVLADFEFDYVMPWNPNNEYGDVIDTEISLPIGQSDVDWLNEEAKDIANGYENGELVVSSRKAGKKKPVKSAKKPIKSMAAVSRDKLMDAGSLGDTIMRDLKLNSIINDPNDFDYPIERGKERNPSQYYLDIKGFGEIKVLVKQDNYRTNRKNGSYSIELSSRKPGDKFENFKNTYYEGNDRNEFNADWNDILSQMISLDNVITQMNSSRKPIQSMYVTEDISGNDLYTCLWSGGKDQFNSMIEDGADPDDILNACEELLFREEGNPPTMTELNDLIWFEPDTIRDYIGLSNPIESGCHGKSKKDKKKKAVKSAKKSIKSAYNPWNGEGSIRVSLEVVEDGEHSSPDFSNTVMDLDDFVAECKSYAESCNGYYFVSENDSNSYKIEFRTGDDSFTDNPGTDPYYEESCGIVIAELTYPYTTDMADYIENA